MINEKVMELKQMLELKDVFFISRHGEKKDLINLRQTFAVDLINLRDTVAGRRHEERIEIIERKFSQ